MKLSGPNGLVGESVVDAGPGIGLVFDQAEQDASLILATILPATTVDENDERTRLGGLRLWQVEVKLLARVVSADVIEISHDMIASRALTLSQGWKD
jgi:hypothetical protein